MEIILVIFLPYLQTAIFKDESSVIIYSPMRYLNPYNFLHQVDYSNLIQDAVRGASNDTMHYADFTVSTFAAKYVLKEHSHC